MSVVAAFAVGVLAIRLLRLMTHHSLSGVALERLNYRRALVPTGIGVLIPCALLFNEAGRAVVGASGIGDMGAGISMRHAMVLAVSAFALLGFVDDLAGNGTDRGFSGHLRALWSGRLTTGGLKLFGGGAVAAVVVAPMAGGSLRDLMVGALLVALSANLGNLFDRAPGRCIKAGLLAYVPIAVLAGSAAAGIATAPLAGAAFGLLGDDLHERVMLGDAGANALGAGLGLAAVLTLGDGAQLWCLLGVAGLNLASEWVSFSSVIDRTSVLRLIDRWGRAVADEDMQF